MTKKERFLEVLKSFNRPVTVLEWVDEVVNQYPSILTQINSKTNEKMRLKDMVMDMGLKISKGEFSEIKILDTKPYRQIIYLSEKMKTDLIKEEIREDLESLLVKEKKREDIKKSTESDRYRLEELESIVEQLNRYFSLNFELHHALSLTNKSKQGKHHVDNLQLLTKEHTLVKKDGEKKFTIDEQKAYIKRIISVQMMINKRIDISLIDEVLEMLLERLEKVY